MWGPMVARATSSTVGAISIETASGSTVDPAAFATCLTHLGRSRTSPEQAAAAMQHHIVAMSRPVIGAPRILRFVSVTTDGARFQKEGFIQRSHP